MKTINKYPNVITALLVGVVAVIVFLGTIYLEKAQVAMGSVNVSNEYNATTTGMATGFASSTVVKSSAGVLGSVVVTAGGTAPMYIIDATTTDISKRTGNTATSALTMITISPSQTVGTYTLDVGFKRGLLVYVDGAPGVTMATTTITYR